MTLIVGIVAKDGIVLAADSQTSYNGLKLPGTNKINVVKFKCGKVVMVAEAGMVVLSNQAVEIIKSKAKDVEGKDKESVSKVVQESLWEVRRAQMALYPPGEHSLEDWKIYFRDQNAVELTTAFYIGDEPSLFTITLDECVPHFSKDYSASGCGDSLGNYLLKEHFAPGMEYELAATIAIKVAKDAATYVEGCDAPIKAAWIRRGEMVEHAVFHDAATYRPEYIMILDQDKVDEIIAIIDSAERESKAERLKKVHEALEIRSKEAIEALFREMEKVDRLSQGLKGSG